MNALCNLFLIHESTLNFFYKGTIMQKQNVIIGNEYVAKIDGKVLVVQIEAEHKSGGWIAKDLETQKPLRINNVRKLIRSAHPAETASAAKQSSPPQTDKKLSAEFAYETWRRNNNINGLIIFETSDKHLMFGDNAQIAAVALKREKEIFKSSFKFEKKSFLEKVLQVEDAEVSGIMSNLGNSGNHVFLAVQKTEDGKKVQLFEIVKHVLAGHTDVQPGLPPFSSIKATPEVIKKRKTAATRAEVKEDTRYPQKTPAVQKIDIKPGGTFKSQSGNEYHIQMVSDSAVYAQQIRDGKPCGPTRPFDKKSVEVGNPKGLHGEDSYYPKSEALEAAEKVLQNAIGPMTTKAMMIEIRKQKLWFTTARMPHTTLAAAIARDMKRNAQDSRFIRLDRGLFQLANKPVAKQPAKPAEPETPAKDAKKKSAKSEPKKTSAATVKAKVVKTYIKKPAPKKAKTTPKKKK